MQSRSITRRNFLKVSAIAAASGWIEAKALPLNLSVAASFEKSKLHSNDAFVPLVKITWPDNSVLRLVRNTDDVVFDAGDGAGPQNYTAFAWDFAELQESSDGSVPTWAIKVSNVNHVVESLLEQYSGGVGSSISVYVVQLKRLKREPELELDFDITGSMADSRWVTLTLGAQSPLRVIFTRHQYTADVCHWRYKGPECGYTGPMHACSYRLSGTQGCRAHFAAGTALPFGGYPGIDSNGLREVPK